MIAVDDESAEASRDTRKESVSLTLHLRGKQSKREGTNKNGEEDVDDVSRSRCTQEKPISPDRRRNTLEDWHDVP